MWDNSIYDSVTEGQFVLKVSALVTVIKDDWKLILEVGFLCCYCKKIGLIKSSLCSTLDTTKKKPEKKKIGWNILLNISLSNRKENSQLTLARN